MWRYTRPGLAAKISIIPSIATSAKSTALETKGKPGNRELGQAAGGDCSLAAMVVIAYAALTMKKAFTDKQGQYLAFIYYYSKIHGTSPSEAELQQYFRVSPPSVHQMILTLETRGLIVRTPGQARSIRLLISREELPDLI